jgi:hypothetical protein
MLLTLLATAQFHAVRLIKLLSHQRRYMKISINWLKIVISAAAISVIIVRIWKPDLKIDAITFGLIVVAILPWLSELIESAKFPGGWEVKFRDLREAGEKVTGSVPSLTSEATSSVPLSFVAIAEHDPNLALVGLRIEIEKRLREYATKYGINERQPLSRLLIELAQREVLPQETVGGLKELIYAGNSAAHGAYVQAGVAEWAIDFGPKILAALDSQLK